jgi:hypothetical protein
MTGKTLKNLTITVPFSGVTEQRKQVSVLLERF